MIVLFLAFTISLTLKEWNCKIMIDPVGAVRSQVSSTLFGYISGKFGLIICVLVQYSTSESKPSEAGQLFDPQK